MEYQITISPALHGAAQIFLDELEGHLSFFQPLVEELSQEQNNESPLPANTRQSIKHRMHVIKGAAGFLGLTELQHAAGQGEKYFAPANAAILFLPDVHRELGIFLPVLCQTRDKLAQYLAAA